MILGDEENFNAELQEFSYLWSKDNTDDVLVKDMDGYMVVNRKNKTALLIEDEELSDIVIEKMINSQKPVFDSIQDAFNEKENGI